MKDPIRSQCWIMCPRVLMFSPLYRNVSQMLNAASFSNLFVWRTIQRSLNHTSNLNRISLSASEHPDKLCALKTAIDAPRIDTHCKQWACKDGDQVRWVVPQQVDPWDSNHPRTPSPPPQGLIIAHVALAPEMFHPWCRFFSAIKSSENQLNSYENHMKSYKKYIKSDETK